MTDPAPVGPHSPSQVAQHEKPDRQLLNLWQQGQQPDVWQFLVCAGELPLSEVAEVLQVDQQQQWHRGVCIPVETYFHRKPALQGDLENALFLIRNEFSLRRERGES